MKPKGKRLLNPAKRSIHVKGKWKSIVVDPSVFSEEGMEGLVCFEELTNYRLVDSEKAAANAAKELNKEKKKRAQKRKVSEETGAVEEGEASTAETPKKKEKKKTKKNKKIQEEEKDQSAEKVAQPDEAVEGTEIKEEPVSSSEQDTSKPIKKKKKKTKKTMKQENLKQTTSVTAKQPEQETTSEGQPLEMDKAPKNKPRMLTKKQAKNWTNAAISGCEDKNNDMSAWKDLFVPSPVLKALSGLGFGSPTPIQALALPSAIRDRMDILGAAETGTTFNDTYF